MASLPRPSARAGRQGLKAQRDHRDCPALWDRLDLLELTGRPAPQGLSARLDLLDPLEVPGPPDLQGRSVLQGLLAPPGSLGQPDLLDRPGRPEQSDLPGQRVRLD